MSSSSVEVNIYIQFHFSISTVIKSVGEFDISSVTSLLNTAIYKGQPDRQRLSLKRNVDSFLQHKGEETIAFVLNKASDVIRF